jgi:DNA polymerase III delta subunit
MLYIYHGSDIPKSLEKARTLANSLRTKRPDATFIEVGADSWSRAVIEENIGGQGLFSNKYIMFLNRVTEHADAKESLSELVEVMHESSNIFIMLEGKLNAELKKSVEKHADKVVETEKKEGKKEIGKDGKSEFNIFALADAVGMRNALSSWSIYREAVDSGLEIESIIGTLFWQVKSMIVARGATSASASGLSPFVYSKSKKSAEQYSTEELDTLLTDLIKIYHDSHRGMADAELGVERMMLGLGNKV